MDSSDLFAGLLVTGLAMLGWLEWRKVRQADELHRLWVREAALNCHKLERELAATDPPAAGPGAARPPSNSRREEVAGGDRVPAA